MLKTSKAVELGAVSPNDRLPTLGDVITNPQVGSVGNSRRKSTSVNGSADRFRHMLIGLGSRLGAKLKEFVCKHSVKQLADEARKPGSYTCGLADDAEAVPQGTTLEYSHRVRGVQPEQFIDTLTHELQRRAHRPLILNCADELQGPQRGHYAPLIYGRDPTRTDYRILAHLRHPSLTLGL